MRGLLTTWFAALHNGAGGGGAAAAARREWRDRLGGGSAGERREARASPASFGAVCVAIREAPRRQSADRLVVLGRVCPCMMPPNLESSRSPSFALYWCTSSIDPSSSPSIYILPRNVVPRCRTALSTTGSTELSGVSRTLSLRSAHLRCVRHTHGSVPACDAHLPTHGCVRPSD